MAQEWAFLMERGIVMKAESGIDFRADDVYGGSGWS